MSLYDEAPAAPAADGAAAELIVPDYAAPPAAGGTAPAASMGSGGVVPGAAGAGGAAGLMDKMIPKVFATVSPDMNATNKVAAAEAAALQTKMYNIVYVCIILNVIHIMYDMFIEGQEMDSFFQQFFSWLAVLGLGYYGAKHRDTDMLLWFLISGGLCVLLLTLVSVLFLYNFLTMGGEPLTGEEAEMCTKDPECTQEELNGEIVHPLDSIPTIGLNIFLWFGLITAYQLYKHPTSNDAMRMVAV
jgi:hypothetical protein